MLSFLSLGIALGLSAGVAPGPLLALVISETLRHGPAAGMKVACAPILTDLPIIALSLFVLARLAAQPKVLGLISLAGGFLLLSLGWQHLRSRETPPSQPEASPRPLIKGIAVNLLSPHPYLFWLSVGAPLTTRAMAQGAGAAIAFIAGFYILLVGSKIVLALAAGTSRSFLSGRAYLLILRLLGLLLWGLAFLLLREGLNLLQGTGP
ncbi:MAG: LysE family translocator [Thermodesulfobacteriota bacterium]